jgi:hypothetical protein
MIAWSARDEERRHAVVVHVVDEHSTELLGDEDDDVVRLGPGE